MKKPHYELVSEVIHKFPERVMMSIFGQQQNNVKNIELPVSFRSFLFFKILQDKRLISFSVKYHPPSVFEFLDVNLLHDSLANF